jgi:hypothetical protein
MATAVYRRQQAPPNELTITWEGVDGADDFSETYYAVPSVPAQTLLDVMAARDEGLTPAETFQRVLDFADAVFVPESGLRFAERMKGPRGSSPNPEYAIDLPMLQWAIERLAEFYGSGRPTAPSDPSSDGPSPTGPSSTAPAPSPDSTASTSTPPAT